MGSGAGTHSVSLRLGAVFVALAVVLTGLAVSFAPVGPAVAAGDSDYRAKILEQGANLWHYWRLGDASSATTGADEVPPDDGVAMNRYAASFGASGIFSADGAASFTPTPTESGFQGMRSNEVGLTTKKSASVDLWVKPSALPAEESPGVPGRAVLFDTQDADSGLGYDSGLTLELGSDGFVTGRAGFDNPSLVAVPVASVRSTSQLAVGVWAHLTLSWLQNGQLRLYMNGAPQAFGWFSVRDVFWEWGGYSSPGHRVHKARVSLGVSANDRLSNPFTGSIDEVRLTPGGGHGVSIDHAASVTVS